MILKTGELAPAILENKGVNGYDPENIWVIPSCSLHSYKRNFRY
jgi:hypothetical protein